MQILVLELLPYFEIQAVPVRLAGVVLPEKKSGTSVLLSVCVRSVTFLNSSRSLDLYPDFMDPDPTSRFPDLYYY
jgi:hypothetical protein